MNLKQYLVTAALIVLALGGIALLMQSQSNGPSTAGAANSELGPSPLSVAETFFDFGTVSMGKGTVTHTFTIKNTLANPVKLTRLYTSCMCTKATYRSVSTTMGPFGMQGHAFVPPLNVMLGSGETADIEAVFDPAAHGPAGVGQIARTVYLETESGAPVELNFKAMVTP